MTKIYFSAEYDSIDIETLPAVTLRGTKRHEHTAIDNLRTIAQRWQVFAPSTIQHDDNLLNAAADLIDLIGQIKNGGVQEKLNGWIELWRWLDAQPK